MDRNSLFSFWGSCNPVGRHQLPGYGLCLDYTMKEGGLGKLQKKMRGRFGDMVCGMNSGGFNNCLALSLGVEVPCWFILGNGRLQ